MRRDAPALRRRHDVIRVAFAWNQLDAGWLGGLNYIRNLVSTLARVPGCGIEPVALVSPANPSSAPVPDILRIPTSLLDARALPRAARGVSLRALERDLPVESLLARNGVAALSHSEPLGRRSRVASLCWVPDLQHKHLPQFFDAEEKARRDRHYGRLCRDSTLVVASSEHARADIERFIPEGAGKVRVLRFVDSNAPGEPVVDPAALRRRLGIGERYFLLPNQFWIHKNHGVVLDALGVLARRGRTVTVLATGDTKDHRQPGYFEELMRRREALGVTESFRCLGVVPYGDLANLARGAVALINPSRFEGWSTSVEEAKSLGKKILLSDIPVHREQAPPRGRYFGTDDAEALAEELERSWDAHDPAEERAAAAEAAARLPARRAEYAEAYAAIVVEAIGLSAASR